MKNWYGRLFASFSIGIFIYAMLWISAQFREGPGFGVLSLIFLFAFYLCWEVILFYQQRTRLWNKKKYGTWTYPIIIINSILLGTLFFASFYYCFKWIDFLINRNEPPGWGHMLMSGLVGSAISVLFTTISISINWRDRLIASELENEGYKKAPENFWRDKTDALMKLLTQKQVYKERFLFKVGNGFLPVTTEQIAYFYRDDLVFARLFEDKSIPVDYSLNQLTELIDPTQFVRLNRQFLVNINAIEKLFIHKPGQLRVTLRPDVHEEIVLSQERSAFVKKLLG